MRFSWSLKAESHATADGGDFEEAIEDIEGLIENPTLRQVVLRAPDSAGAYRLFIETYDGQGSAGYANLPFLVADKAPSK